jgi:glycosyltransferase involved in cell wall biosynthesis
MKIVQVAHGFPQKSIGGVELHTYYLSKELSKEHEVFVFSREFDLTEKNLTLKKKSVEKIQVTTLVNNIGYPANFEESYKNSAIDTIFREYLESVKPDIVHFQHLIGLSLNLPNIAKDMGIKTLISIHDFWFICPSIQLLTPHQEICDHTDKNKRNCYENYYYRNPKILDHIIRYTPNSIKNLIPDNAKKEIAGIIRKILLKKNKSEKHAGITDLEKRDAFFQKTFASADVIVFFAQFAKDIFEQNNFRSPNKIEVIHYGIFEPRIKKVEKKQSDRLRFGYIGNILPHKGAHLLISAFNKISNENVDLKIYGDTNQDPAYSKKLRKMSKNPHVQFCGKYFPESLPKIFSEIDIMVMPSIWLEMAPFVIIEALAAGVPVITANIGGMREIIQRQNGGILFNFRDEEDLCSKIKTVISNPEIINSLSEKIKPIKTIAEHASEMNDLYKKLLA